MAEAKTLRLNKVLRELNISLDRAVEHLSKNGNVPLKKHVLANSCQYLVNTRQYLTIFVNTFIFC